MLRTEQVMRHRRNDTRYGSFESEEECKEIYDIVREKVDFVGTTERMSTELQPLLYYMLNRTAAQEDSKPRIIKKNKSNALEFESDMDNTTMARIRELLKFDQDIFDKVRRDYNFSQHFPEFELKKAL